MAGNAGKGRPKGVPNKRSQQVEEILARLKCDPITGMAHIAAGNVPCAVCKGKGTTKYQPSRTTRLIDGIRVYLVDGEEGEARLKDRTCLSCYGSGQEIIGPELRAKMYAELAQYRYPKRKAIEVTGENGEPIKHAHTIKFVS